MNEMVEVASGEMSSSIEVASGEMSSSIEVVGTYNMSWASDSSETMDILKGKASEYSFLLKNKGTQRAFWENAKTHLQTFITEKKPIAVGLQEMNVTADGAPTGTGAIKAILPEEYIIVSETVESKFSKDNTTAAIVGISIIIDITRTGPVIKKQVLDNDKQTGFVDGGRPLLMVLTEKGYLFVNMHGAQNPGLGKDKTKFNEYMVTNNRNVLETKVSEFISGQTVQTIYVMGDFNDRYDAITEFTIDGKSVKYAGESPKSCCHNWDSSSVEGRRVELGDGYFYGKDPTIDLYKDNFADGKFNGKTEIPDEDVKIKNYLYKGDKVFSNKSGKLFMFNSGLESVSDKSDHELVYFEETVERIAKEEAERIAEAQQKAVQGANQDIDFEGIPKGCNTIKPLINDYKQQFDTLNSLDGKSTKIAQKILNSAVTRLDGIRTKSLNGDNDGAAIEGRCPPFPDWYNKNKSWFSNQFIKITEYMNIYNITRKKSEQISMPMNGNKPYNFSGGKTKKKIYNKKRFLTRKSSSRVSRKTRRQSITGCQKSRAY